MSLLALVRRQLVLSLPMRSVESGNLLVGAYLNK
jgi:hypothetical protein